MRRARAGGVDHGAPRGDGTGDSARHVAPGATARSAPSHRIAERRVEPVRSFRRATQQAVNGLGHASGSLCGKILPRQCPLFAAAATAMIAAALFSRIMLSRPNTLALLLISWTGALASALCRYTRTCSCIPDRSLPIHHHLAASRRAAVVANLSLR